MKNKGSILFICVGILIMGIGLYGLWDIFSQYQEADEKHDVLEEQYVEKLEMPELQKKLELKQIEWYELAMVDVPALKEKYPNVVGWIFFENEEISYPIMQADNVIYVTTSYDGSYSSSGSIFLNETDSSDFSDMHTIIYGHNMKNLSMFGRLKFYYRKENYFESHKYFQIFTENEILRYEVFSYQEVPVDSEVYTKSWKSATELGNYLMARAMESSGKQIADEDQIITLSTCTGSDEYRFIVNGVLVDRYPIEWEE